jgi:hypothetical protein
MIAEPHGTARRLRSTPYKRIFETAEADFSAIQR